MDAGAIGGIVCDLCGRGGFATLASLLQHKAYRCGQREGDQSPASYVSLASDHSPLASGHSYGSLTSDVDSAVDDAPGVASMAPMVVGVDEGPCDESHGAYGVHAQDHEMMEGGHVDEDVHGVDDVSEGVMGDEVPGLESDDESSVVEWDGDCLGEDGWCEEGGMGGGGIEEEALAGYDIGVRDCVHDDEVHQPNSKGWGQDGGDVSSDDGWGDDEDEGYAGVGGAGDGDGKHVVDLNELLENLHEPIYVGARMTVLQATFLAMHEKREGRVRDGVFDRQCRVMKEVILPKGNLYPGSLYLMRKVLGCQEADDVSIHMCVNGCQSWEHVPRRLWKHHADDTCPSCGSARFLRNQSGILRPQKEFFYFGLQRAVQHQFCNPSFRDLRGVARPEAGRYSNEYYGSPECARLHEAAGIKTVSWTDVQSASDDQRQEMEDQWRLYQDTSVWDLGMDFFQPYDTRAYSIGLILLRCADLPDQVKNQMNYSSLLGITVGPKEPSSMDAYLQPIISELMQAWKRGVNVQVPCEEGGTRSFTHHVLLGGVFADEPASKKISKWKSHGSYLACGFCNCRGVLDPSTNTVRYPPVMQYGFYAPGACHAPSNPEL